MILPLLRYSLSDLLRSQRFLIPCVLYAGLLAVLFGGDPGAPPAPWAASGLALYPVAAWLAVTVANTEDPVQRDVTTAAAGSPWRVVGGLLATCLVVDVVLVAMAIVWPMIATRYEYPPQLVVAGALAHLAAAVSGTAVGLACARPVLRGIGWTALAVAGIVVVTGIQNWLPPVGTAIKALDAASPSLLVLARDVAIALALAALAGTLSVRFSRRR
ncbi:hypothetical protein [Pseudonocardia sp. TRM90224]|uniref:hypothetical protein n=1 Tax=Pseudonocardia sp. TRM90224 TaxID=2812678 RepID=UPI001E3340CF|nr:hypothetical protein [Pseudonocardia sp. TRM90224]